MIDMDILELRREMQKRREIIKANMKKIKYKIAVMSGKGGVGKTTVAVNLAVSLAKTEPTKPVRVALLDADIDCPNVNKFMGIEEHLSVKNEKIIPIKKYGIDVVSFASLQEREDQPIIWRGPMLSKAIMQLLEQVEWGKLDYLVIDLPPGTSDSSLTIMQELVPDGIIVVTTPTDVAVVDAKKSVNMAKKLKIPVLGIIENMSGEIFGTGGGEKAAADIGVKFLGRLKLDAGIARCAEKKKPFVLESFESAEEFKHIVNTIVKEVLK
ncbi:MAG: Mrp/NBP35 family ATP-binding protein [Candidatus Aenigmarchaeota archaeon]|nr:Mrp/NBP35 family ATP-binding protein [Candidatus Aenigmarchaeota archaeon]